MCLKEVFPLLLSPLPLPSQQFPPPPNAVGGAQPSFGFGPGGFQAVPLTVQQQQLGQGLSGSPLLGGTPLLGGAPSSTGSSSNSASSQPPPSLPLPFGSSSSPAVTIPPPPRHPAAVAATTGGGSGLFGLSPTQQATPLSSVPVPVPAPSPSPAGGDPLAVLDNLSVALETIKPGKWLLVGSYLMHTCHPFGGFLFNAHQWFLFNAHPSSFAGVPI